MIHSKSEAVAILQDTSQTTLEREHAIHYLREHTLEQAEIEVLVTALQDDAPGIRFAAGSVLAANGRAVVPALLRALTRVQSDTLLRAGAHHVLHDNVNLEVRHQSEELLQALRGPASDVAAMDAAGHWLQRLASEA